MHFQDYANYYNLLYKDKDYKAEADYIHSLIQQSAPQSKSLIDLGCGTGNHAFEFEKLGYEVTGVDLSTQMVAIANINKEKNNSTISFGEAIPVNGFVIVIPTAANDAFWIKRLRLNSLFM